MTKTSAQLMKAQLYGTCALVRNQAARCSSVTDG